MNNPTYMTECGLEIAYEPLGYVGGLDWFNIATCARKRMTEAVATERWVRERESFWHCCSRAVPFDFK